MAIDRVEDLRVYRAVFAAAMDIFELSKSWPKEERYALTDQIRRSSRAVFANPAEAWRKKQYPRHFVSKLSDAEAEANETRTWLRFSSACEYISDEAHARLSDGCNYICGGLVQMINNPEKWCIREDGAQYTFRQNLSDALPLSDSQILGLSGS